MAVERMHKLESLSILCSQRRVKPNNPSLIGSVDYSQTISSVEDTVELKVETRSRN